MAMSKKQIDIKKVRMIYEQNPLTGDWLCWIPSTAQAYYVPKKSKAIKFCNKVNEAFDKGELEINEDGKVEKVAFPGQK